MVGIGVNVQWHEIPDELAALATACNIEAGQAVDREEVLDAFLDRLGARSPISPGTAEAYRDRLATLGRRVRVDRAPASCSGSRASIDPMGELLVETDDGITVPVHAGDVMHLRDA